MADQKLTELIVSSPLPSPIAATDLLYVVRGSVSYATSGASAPTSAVLTQTGVQLGASLQQTGAYLYQHDLDISGALQAQIAGGGGISQAQLDSLSGWSASAENLTQTGVQLASTAAATYATIASLAITGQQAWTVANNNGTALSGALTQTGIQLAATATATYATIANLQTSGSSLYSLVTAFSGQADTNYATQVALLATGQQAWLAANNNGVALSGALTQTGVQLAATATATYATIANLAATGSNLYSTLIGLSGQAVTDYATNVDLGSTGQQNWLAANNNAVVISGNLTQTGVQLAATAAATYATITNVAATGSNLYATLIGFSGQAVIDYATAAQGAKADTAVQPAAISTMVTAAAVITNGALAGGDGGARGVKEITVLPNGTTATTQTAADNSTKVATTAYVDAAGFVTTNGTVTLTNKRITLRIATLTDAATVTPATDSYDGGILTTLSQTTDFLNPTGTPTDGQKYTLRIKSAAAQVLTWTNGGSGTQYRGSADLALPASTSGSNLTDYLIFQWNAADSKWDILATNNGF